MSMDTSHAIPTGRITGHVFPRNSPKTSKHDDLGPFSTCHLSAVLACRWYLDYCTEDGWNPFIEACPPTAVASGKFTPAHTQAASQPRNNRPCTSHHPSSPTILLSRVRVPHCCISTRLGSFWSSRGRCRNSLPALHLS